MIANQRRFIAYLAVGLFLGGGLVTLLFFWQIDPYLPNSNIETSRPRISFTASLNLTELEASVSKEIPTLSKHSLSQPAISSLNTSNSLDLAKSASQTPVLIAHNPANVRTGPGVAYDLLVRLAAGQKVTVTGRNADGTWLAIPCPTDNPPLNGWVSAAVVTVEGDIGRVPVISVSPLVPMPRYR